MKSPSAQVDQLQLRPPAMSCLKSAIGGFGTALKQWRAKAGISQEELAFRAGLHRTYVSSVERGARNVSLQTIARLARALNISLAEMFEPLGQFPKSLQDQPQPRQGAECQDLERHDGSGEE